ncbi:hypothetical protein P9112_004605 [Eukaryota sp. TZLM1-RC]
MISGDLTDLITDLRLAELPYELVSSFTCIHFSDRDSVILSELFDDTDTNVLQQLCSAIQSQTEESFLLSFRDANVDPLALIVALSYFLVDRSMLSLLSIKAYLSILVMSSSNATRFSNVFFVQECLVLLEHFTPLLHEDTVDVFTTILALLSHLSPLFARNEQLLTKYLSTLTTICSFPFSFQKSDFPLPSDLFSNNQIISLPFPCIEAFNCLFSIWSYFNQYLIDVDEELLGNVDESDEDVVNFFYKLYGSFVPSLLLCPTDLTKNEPKTVLTPHLLVVSSIFCQIVQYFAKIPSDLLFDPVLSLLRTLLSKCPPRADCRSNVCEILTLLIEPLSVRYQSIKILISFLLRLTRNQTVSSRLISVDGLASLLPFLLNPSNFDGESFYDLFCEIFPSAFERLADVSPFVRIRSIHFLISLFKILKSSTDPTLISSIFNSFLTPDALDSIIIRLHDPKPSVRKTAVCLLPHILFHPSTLSCFRTMTFDCSAVVRKQTIVELGNLLERFDEVGASTLSEIGITEDSVDCLVRIFVENILTLSNDSEASVKLAIINSLRNLILSKIGHVDLEVSSVFTRILRFLNHSHIPHLHNLIEFLIAKEKDKKLNLSQALNFNESISDDFLKGLLIISVAVSRFFQIKFPLALLESSIMRFPLIMSYFFDPKSHSISLVSSRATSNLISSCKVSLQDTFTNPNQAHCLMKCLFLLSDDSITNWCEGLLENLAIVFVETFTNFVQNKIHNIDQKVVCNQLFLIGELSLVVKVNLKLLDQVVSILHTIITPGQLQAVPGSIPGGATFEDLIAHSIITLGKLMSVSEAIAKKSVNILGALLGTIKSSIKPVPITSSKIRANILIVFSNLCQRFPGLVDARLQAITQCLADESLEVSKAALAVISLGLKEDFLKLRPALYFRLLFASTRAHLAGITRAVIFSAVVNRSQRKGFLVAQFVDSLFVLNGLNPYKQGSTSAYFEMLHDDVGMFSLQGTSNSGKRRSAYATVLQFLSDSDKFNVANKVVELLGEFAAGEFSVIDHADVISDCFSIVCSKEVRMASISDVVSDKQTDVDDSESRIDQANQRMVTSLLRQNLAELIVPTFASLRVKLGQYNSPLLGELFECLNILLDEFSNDLEKVLVSDKQFADEVLLERRLKKGDEHSSPDHVTPGRRSLGTPHLNKLNPEVVSSAMVKLSAASIARSRVQSSARTNSSRHVATPLRSVDGAPVALESPGVHQVVRRDRDIEEEEEEISAVQIAVPKPQSKSKKKTDKPPARRSSRLRRKNK